MTKRVHTPIKFRNALTELWNEGHSLAYIAQQQGITEEQVEQGLFAARAGFNTHREHLEAKGAAEVAKATRGRFR